MRVRVMLQLCLVTVLFVCSVHASEPVDPVAAETIARRFIDSISVGDPAIAYDLFSEEVQQELEPEQFFEEVKDLGGKMGDLHSVDLQEGPSDGSACVGFTFLTRYDYGEVQIKLSLCEKGGAPRVTWFDSQLLTLDLEAAARTLIVSTLKKAGFPEPESFDCPDPREGAAAEITHCRAGFGQNCTLTIGLAMTEDGFVIVGAEKTDACDSVVVE